MDDKELLTNLISKIAAGNEGAFEELYYLTYQKVYAYLLSLTKNPADAEDLLQETYLRIRGGSHLYKDQNSPMAWIYKIGKNLFLMKVRKESRYQVQSFEVVGEVTSALDQIKAADTRMMLQEMFKQLSQEEREIIIMHLVGGLKNREIAEALKMPLGTALSKYNRGIKKLRKLMEGAESNEEKNR